ncbi:ketose-bisphosphate aldolase class-II family protein [Trifolium medium]|uniref:Ketose-bisphosphate aldolase class-II family protein n=1 Tax=Trifolium medium TaxID=97028 RepID=A0A392PL29_9FABA|nr:ketose-bisphosphate aldolase class-II family protein [Trifolium medium]
MVANEVQAENALYGEYGAVSVLPPGATIILSSTVSPAYVSQLERRLHSRAIEFWACQLTTVIMGIEFL